LNKKIKLENTQIWIIKCSNVIQIGIWNFLEVIAKELLMVAGWWQ